MMILIIEKIREDDKVGSNHSLFVMVENKSVRFSFRYTCGNKDFEKTIQVLFSCIAQSNIRGDLTTLIRKHLNEIVSD